MKQKGIIQKLVNEKERKALAVAKAQALIKGYLARRHIAHKLDDSNYKMLMRLSRRLSDKKLYYIFLMIRNKHQVTSVEEPYYLVTLREVKNINEIYDLEISLDMAKKIFGRKSSSSAEVNRLINFETNKQEFKLMLDCLDIINEEFSLDFKKFR